MANQSFPTAAARHVIIFGLVPLTLGIRYLRESEEKADWYLPLYYEVGVPFGSSRLSSGNILEAFRPSVLCVAPGGDERGRMACFSQAGKLGRSCMPLKMHVSLSHFTGQSRCFPDDMLLRYLPLVREDV